MFASAPVAWLLVALCTAAGAYCVLRMRSTVEGQRRAAGVDATMGFGMAVMAVPAAAVRSPPWSWYAGMVVFAAMALHAAWSARRGRHHLHHLVGTSAMVYMAGVMAVGGGRMGHMDQMRHGGPGIPVLTGLLLLYFTGHVLGAGARLVPASGGVAAVGAGGPGPGWADRPEVARACRVAMSIGMLAMLLAL